MLPTNRIRGLFNTVQPPECAESIIARLRAQYAEWMMPNLLDVRIVHLGGRVFLETTTDEAHDGMHDHAIVRADLACWMEGDQLRFPAAADVADNARRFLEEMTPLDLAQWTDLFRDEACQSIDEDSSTDEGPYPGYS